MTRAPFRRVVGSCYFCGGPVRAGDNAYPSDRAAGVKRLTHRGLCAERLEAKLTPIVEGGPAMIFDPVVTASAIVAGERVTLVRMTVAELVDSYLGIDRQTEVVKPELAITLAGRTIEPEAPMP